MENIQSAVVQAIRNVYLKGQKIEGNVAAGNSIIQFLRTCVGGLVHIFARLDEDLLRKEIVHKTPCLMLASGQPIPNFIQGAGSLFFYIIVSGNVQLYRQQETQLQDQTLEKLKKQPYYINEAPIGDKSSELTDFQSFGEHTLMLNLPRKYTAICTSPSILLAIPKVVFHLYLAKFFKELKERYEKVNFLQQVPIFQNWGQNRLLRIAEQLTPFMYAKGKKLLKEGHLSKRVIFIETGMARVLSRVDPYFREEARKRKTIIGEHRVERFKTRKVRKKTVEIMTIGHGSMWGEGSLLWKGLLRSGNDARMNAAESIDSSSAILMTKEQNVEIADVVSDSPVSGYHIVSKDLSNFLSACNGTRFITDAAKLYEERKMFISNRLQGLIEYLDDGVQGNRPGLSFSPIRLAPIEQGAVDHARKSGNLVISPMKTSRTQFMRTGKVKSKYKSPSKRGQVSLYGGDFQSRSAKFIAGAAFSDKKELDIYINNVLSSSTREHKVKSIVRKKKINPGDKLEPLIRRLKVYGKKGNERKKSSMMFPLSATVGSYQHRAEARRQKLRRARASRNPQTNVQVRMMLQEAEIFQLEQSIDEESPFQHVFKDSSKTDDHKFMVMGEGKTQKSLYDPWNLM